MLSHDKAVLDGCLRSLKFPDLVEDNPMPFVHRKVLAPRHKCPLNHTHGLLYECFFVCRSVPSCFVSYIVQSTRVSPLQLDFG